MADVRISPALRLRGQVRVPGDKSIAHRALFCGALAGGWTRITGVPRSADISATIRALDTCGVQIQRNDEGVIVQGEGLAGWSVDGANIDCNNSGTTMRLLMGALAGKEGSVRLLGDASLCRRPMERIAEPLRRMGADVMLSDGGSAPLRVTGSPMLRAIDYDLPIPSAQLKSAVLFAALGAKGRTRLRGFIGSRDHTERMLPLFGATLQASRDEIAIERLRGSFIAIPGDISSAAYWIAAAVLTPRSKIALRNVSLNPTRSGFVEVLQRMGAHVDIVQHTREPEPAGTIYAQSSALRGIIVEASQVPSVVDELPLLAVMASQADGVTVVRGAQELRVKESDRIEAIAAVLRAMGVTVQTFEDGFCIYGRQTLRSASIDPHGDHRIAMSASIAGLVADGETSIKGAQCVGISYPTFFSTLVQLGGNVQ